MSNRVSDLASALIRNINEVPLTRLLREPLYDGQGARLARGTAAQKLGASFDILAPGKRGCPYHLHHAQEEMFVILEGRGTLRVADEMLPLKTGDVIFIPAGPEYPHQIINTSDAPLKYLSISTMEALKSASTPTRASIWLKVVSSLPRRSRQLIGGSKASTTGTVSRDAKLNR